MAVVLRGDHVPPDPVISAIVLSVHSDPLTKSAVASLLAQDVAAEIVVVNTGSGTLRDLLADELGQIVLVEDRLRRLVGAARNLGIEHSTAGLVAFLASDCVATPEWLRRRVEAHRQGSKMVASALMPAACHGERIHRPAWASYAMTHIGRTPQTPSAQASRYGLSYARELFDGFGPFNEALQVGEDTDFNRRASSGEPILWRPDIITRHRYPCTLPAAASDQFRRGRRTGEHHRQLDGRPPLRHVIHVLLHGRLVFERIGRGFSPPQTRSMAVRLLILMLLLAHIVGVLSLYLKPLASVRPPPAAAAS